MKGISKFFGMFLNIMQIIFIIIGLFAIFVTITTFGYSTEFVAGTRESVMVMQAVLSAPCLTVLASDGYSVRALFDEQKLKDEATIVGSTGPSCISYRQNIKIVVSGHETPIVIGDTTLGTVKFTEYPAALKTIEGPTIPIHVTVSVESENECTKPGEYICMTGQYGNEIRSIPIDEMYSTVYKGKCVNVDGELVIQKIGDDGVENCNTQYYADKDMVDDWYNQFGGDNIIDENEYNVCACQYVDNNAMCTYPGEIPDAKWACTKVD